MDHTGNTVCGGAGTSAALQSGLLAEAVLTERVVEALVPMFRLGAFDAPADVEWKDRSKVRAQRPRSRQTGLTLSFWGTTS
eukprot:SAG22_NODE_1498_length_4288_cov_3.110289_4_plen_81_part_00